MAVAASATDRAGTPISAPKFATFKVVSKPKPLPG
jgi:hypothetical protein